MGTLTQSDAVPSDLAVHAACAHAHCVLGARYSGAATLACGGRGEAAGGSGGAAHRGRRRGKKKIKFFGFFFLRSSASARASSCHFVSTNGAGVAGRWAATDACGVGVRMKELASDGDAGFGEY